MFERIAARIGLPDRVGLEALLEAVGPSSKTPYNRLKQPAGKASWSGFREQVEHLRWVDSLGDSAAWLEGIAESKIADFAGGGDGGGCRGDAERRAVEADRAGGMRGPCREDAGAR